MRGEQGFTMVELLVSTSLTICIAAAIFAAVHPAAGIFSVQTEAADMQQRIRVARNVLFNDLVLAGAGTDAHEDGGPLINALPPILPYRQDEDETDVDVAGSFRDDVVTLMHVPSRAQTTIASEMPARSAAVRVNVVAGCPLTDEVCGLSDARTLLIYDRNGSFDRFRIDNVAGSLLELHHTMVDSTKSYPAGSRIVEAIVRSYFLRVDLVSGAYQLMRDDGDGHPAAPVLDHVVQIAFEYFGDPQPPLRPAPPEPDQQPTAYPRGENCVVWRDELSNAMPRLAALEPTEAGGLVQLTAAHLTDGPWCPDAGAPNRFDADLLRIRKIAVTVRVESAISALRGPASILFLRPGFSTSGLHFLPDQTIRFQVAPRNMADGGLVQ